MLRIMKWLGAAIALLLGMFAGWRGETASEGETETLPSTPPPTASGRTSSPSPTNAPISAAIARKADPILGPDWHQWAQRIRAAQSTQDLEGIFDDLVAITEYRYQDRKIRSTVGYLLAARWLEIDPAGGADFLLSAKDKAWALFPLLSTWYLEDAKAAQAALSRLPAKLHGLDAEVEVLKHLVRQDPDAALAYMKAIGKYDTQTAFGGAVPWRALAEARPRELANLLSSVEHERLQGGASFKASSLLYIVAEEFTKLDPDAALRWAGQDYDRRIKAEALRSVLRTMARQDPLDFLARMDAWKENKPGPELRRALGGTEDWLAESLAGVDLTVATEWLLKKGGSVPRSFASALALQIGKGEQDVATAFGAVSELADSNSYASNIAFRAMWGHLGQDKISEAFAFLEEQPTAPPRSQAIGGLLRTSMSRDPDQTIEFFRRLPPGPSRDAVTRFMFERTNLERHGSLAAEVIRSLPARERSIAVSTLLKENPRPPGESSLTFNPSMLVGALKDIEHSPERMAAVDRVATHWGAYDPVAALAWSSELPGDESVSASTTVAQSWVREDAWSLGDHLLEEPPGRARDAATSVLIDSLVDTEPDSAFAWAGHLSNPKTQRDARRRAFQAWAKNRPADAEAALASSTLSSSERADLQTLLPE